MVAQNLDLLVLHWTFKCFLFWIFKEIEFIQKYVRLDSILKFLFYRKPATNFNTRPSPRSTSMTQIVRILYILLLNQKCYYSGAKELTLSPIRIRLCVSISKMNLPVDCIARGAVFVNAMVWCASQRVLVLNYKCVLSRNCLATMWKL